MAGRKGTWLLLASLAIAPACSNGDSKDSDKSRGQERQGESGGTPDGAEDHAALEKEHLGDIRCREQVFEVLMGGRGAGGTRFASRREWTRQPARGNDGSVVLVSPTTLPGMWNVVTRYLNGEVVVKRQTARFTTTFTFGVHATDPAQDSCEVHRDSNAEPRKFDEARMARALTDHDVLDLVKKNPVGVIYVWSPHMPYSYDSKLEAQGANGLKNIQEAVAKVSQQTGKPVALTVAVDPGASEELVNEIVSHEERLDENMTQPVEAIELFYRNVNHHYPAVLVYADGLIARHVYPGTETPEKYAAVIGEKLAEISRLRAQLDAAGR